MNFRKKLLILLIVLALVPLLINGLIHRTIITKISNQLTTQTREVLEKSSTTQLQTIVQQQSMLLDRDKAFVLQSLEAQVREVEHLLNEPAKLIDLSPAYLRVQRQRPELFLWQATVLTSGVKSLFPTDLQPINDEVIWYQLAKQNQDLQWRLHLVDSQLQLIVAKPLYSGKGEFAGVTAFALNYQQLFNDWQLPAPWDEYGRLFIVKNSPYSVQENNTLNVVFEIVSADAQQITALSAQQIFNDVASTTQFNSLLSKMRQNSSSVQTLDFNGQESIWFYAGVITDQAFPLLIIPRHLVTLPAQQASNYVERQFIHGLKLTALLSVLVLLSVLITAFFRSRAVTKPLSQLADAAEQLSQGDFSTQVYIRSSDEFEELGSAFNRIGPQLKERQQIKQSLAIAKDIQQLILPVQPPELDNFELACALDYCDETGGDYYDFIQTNSGKWGLVVGDVVGHGIGAALLMAASAGILHSAITNGEENLETLFSSMNNFLEKDVGDTRLMTLFFGLLDPSNQSIHWLSAGHGPIFLYRSATGLVEELPATTIPLGVMADVDFSPIHKDSLSCGDILAIGTDGIWETINSAGEMFGAELVSQLLQELADKSATVITSKLLERVEMFRGDAPKEDDLTLIILKAK